MHPERWQNCINIFQAVVERPPEERSALLDQTCEGDDALRRKVELLLKYHEETGDFIETPAFEVSPELLLDNAEALIGQNLGHYRIESVLGVGGMGVVYLAQDEKLGRKVGLKLLPQSLIADEGRLERLKREARTASALNHPNIVTIHEIGEVDGIHYIATEFIEGATLREQMTRGPIPPNEALEIGLQVASALSVAHASGIVHCDIKPENIMLRPDGYVKVLDFGIAKFTQQENNSAGVEGTKAYMSPEQARGEELDARSDIWSLGVTLREMIAAPVPADLERVISRALSEERNARHKSAAELRADLQRVQRKLEGSPSSRWRMAAAALAALAVAALLYAKLFSPSPAPTLQEKSIAVLPFENLSDEKENAFFVDGVHDEILTNLARIGDLKVISRTSVRQYRTGATRNLREIGKELGVAHLLEGSVQRTANKVRVIAQLIDARTDAHVWAQTFDRDLSDVFAIQSEIAQRIADQLQAKLSPSEHAAMHVRPTSDLVAYDLYLQAKELSRKIDSREFQVIKREVQLLDSAVARDPAFVSALCLLVRAHLTAYWFNHDATPSRLAAAKAALDAATRLSPDAGEVRADARPLSLLGRPRLRKRAEGIRSRAHRLAQQCGANPAHRLYRAAPGSVGGIYSPPRRG